MQTSLRRVYGLALFAFFTFSSVTLAEHGSPGAKDNGPAVAKTPDVCVSPKIGRGGLMSLSLQFPATGRSDSIAFLKAVSSDTSSGGSGAPKGFGDMGKAIQKLAAFDLTVVPGQKAIPLAKTSSTLMRTALSTTFQSTTGLPTSGGVCEAGTRCTILPYTDAKSRKDLQVKAVLSTGGDACKTGDETHYVVYNKTLPGNAKVTSLETLMTPKGGVTLLVPDRFIGPGYDAVQYLRKRFGASVKLARARDDDSEEDTATISGAMAHTGFDKSNQLTVVSRSALASYCSLRPGVFAQRLRAFRVPTPISPNVLACAPGTPQNRYERLIGVGVPEADRIRRETTILLNFGPLGFGHITPIASCPALASPNPPTGLPAECTAAISAYSGPGPQ